MGFLDYTLSFFGKYSEGFIAQNSRMFRIKLRKGFAIYIKYYPVFYVENLPGYSTDILK